MDRDEQVGLDAPGLLHAHLQGDKIIGIAGQHGAHVRFGVELGFQASADGQRDGLLVSAAAPDRTGVFTAMTGIDGDGHHAVHHRFALARLFDGEIIASRFILLLFQITVD